MVSLVYATCFVPPWWLVWKVSALFNSSVVVTHALCTPRAETDGTNPYSPYTYSLHRLLITCLGSHTLQALSYLIHTDPRQFHGNSSFCSPHPFCPAPLVPHYSFLIPARNALTFIPTWFLTRLARSGLTSISAIHFVRATRRLTSKDFEHHLEVDEERRGDEGCVSVSVSCFCPRGGLLRRAKIPHLEPNCPSTPARVFQTLHAR